MENSNSIWFAAILLCIGILGMRLELIADHLETIEMHLQTQAR